MGSEKYSHIHIFDYLDARLGFTRRHRGVMDKPVAEGISYIYCLGGITFLLFLLQVATGLLLSVQYTPSEGQAYASIQRLHTEVAFGAVIRSVHHWAANLMVVMVLLHMLRVFITGAYKSPRELNWVAGAFLLLVTLAFGFTGYLLPWDQKAYWATVVGTNMLASVPVVGHALAALVRGGGDVTGRTLLRFYSFHVLWLPAFFALFVWVHFHILRRVGISGGM